jgi:hypothetical protein
MVVMSSHTIGLEDLTKRLQPFSESLERVYRELHGRVQSLAAELGREEERIRLERLATSGMTIERGHENIEPAPAEMPGGPVSYLSYYLNLLLETPTRSSGIPRRERAKCIVK